MSAPDRPPVRFSDYVKQAAAVGTSAPPVSIKASDLDKCFSWAGIVLHKDAQNPIFTIEERVIDGHKQRVLKCLGELRQVTDCDGNTFKVLTFDFQAAQ